MELTESTPEHIRVFDADATLCGADCSDEDARVVPYDRDPVGDASVHLCSTCTDEWARISDDVERGETVQCRGVRLIDGDADRWWECGEVVPTTVARAIHDGDVRVPVCLSCYEYLFEFDSDVVVTPTEDAPTWAETVFS